MKKEQIIDPYNKDLKGIMMSETNQSERITYSMAPFT